MEHRVTTPGAARERNREASTGRASQPQLRQDVEFGATRLRPRASRGVVRCGIGVSKGNKNTFASHSTKYTFSSRKKKQAASHAQAKQLVLPPPILRLFVIAGLLTGFNRRGRHATPFPYRRNAVSLFIYNLYT